MNNKPIYIGPAASRATIAKWYLIGNDLLNDWLEQIRDKAKIIKYKKVLSPKQINVLFEEYGEPDWQKDRLNVKKI